MACDKVKGEYAVYRHTYRVEKSSSPPIEAEAGFQKALQCMQAVANSGGGSEGASLNPYLPSG